VSEERQPGPEEELLQSTVSAGLLKEFAGDREMFLKLLVRALETTVPERLDVDHAGGWFGRERTIRRLQLDLGDYHYQLAVGKGGALTAARTRVVRGIALKTDEHPVEEWLEALSRDLVEYARTHQDALEALKRRVW
jgi:hypothetical protein